jgi:hypothetical protein
MCNHPEPASFDRHPGAVEIATLSTRELPANQLLLLGQGLTAGEQTDQEKRSHTPRPMP